MTHNQKLLTNLEQIANTPSKIFPIIFRVLIPHPQVYIISTSITWIDAQNSLAIFFHHFHCKPDMLMMAQKINKYTKRVSTEIMIQTMAIRRYRKIRCRCGLCCFAEEQWVLDIYVIQTYNLYIHTHISYIYKFFSCAVFLSTSHRV